jgi:hypothetical protein
MADVRTNACPVEVIEIGDQVFYISLVEHYEIIDPNLPYKDRFRTLFNTLKISTDSRELLSLKVDREMITNLGISLLIASRSVPWTSPPSLRSDGLRIGPSESTSTLPGWSRPDAPSPKPA